MSTEKIIINIADGNRVRAFDPEGLLQVAAYKDAVQALNRCLDQAKSFWDAYSSSPASEPFRVHSALFVEGKRGAGKTSFMVNLDIYCNNIQDRKDLSRDLYFFKPIDPTLLNNEDNFLNVVISQIYKVVSSHKNCVQPDRFWKDFDKVAEALEAGSQIGSCDVTGGDRILATRDYAKLEENLTHFFASACRILGVKALVIAIDDIDMALKWGFEVLEVVRRYLASPLVIPVISGELDQYEIMVMSHFAKELKVSRKMVELTLSGLSSPMDEASDNALLSKVKHLSGEYLKKILPPHQRVRILPVAEIFKGGRPICVKAEDAEIPLNYAALKDGKVELPLLDRLSIGMSYRANGTDGSRPPIKVETSRELIHFLLILQRNGLLTAKLSTNDWKQPSERLNLAKAMNEYWWSQSNLVQCERAKADIEILSTRDENAKLSDIYFFNPREHNQELAKHEISQEVIVALYDVAARSAEFQSGVLNRTLLPMPSFEPFVESMYVRKSDINKNSHRHKIKLMIDIYTYYSYYTSYQQKNFLFFGRAFEIVMSNILGMTSVVSFRRIMNDPPYFSYLYFQPNVTIDIPWDEFDLDIERENGQDKDAPPQLPKQPNFVVRPSVRMPPVPARYAKEEEEWEVKVRKWHAEHKEALHSKLSAQMLYKITYRFFQQISRYKVYNDKPDQRQSLRDQNERFRLILLGAVAIYESEGAKVVRENFALRDIANHKKSNVWSQNIAPLLNDDKTLVAAINKHPLFSEYSSIDGLNEIFTT